MESCCAPMSKSSKGRLPCLVIVDASILGCSNLSQTWSNFNIAMPERLHVTSEINRTPCLKIRRRGGCLLVNNCRPLSHARSESSGLARRWSHVPSHLSFASPGSRHPWAILHVSWAKSRVTLLEQIANRNSFAALNLTTRYLILSEMAKIAASRRYSLKNSKNHR